MNGQTKETEQMGGILRCSSRASRAAWTCYSGSACIGYCRIYNSCRLSMRDVVIFESWSLKP